jgi:hypothetical protein
MEKYIYIYSVMVTSEELVGTIECLTLLAKGHVSRCHYNRVRLYIAFAGIHISSLFKLFWLPNTPHRPAAKRWIEGMCITALFNPLKPSGNFTYDQV